MIDIRLRNQLSAAAVEPMFGKILTDAEYGVLLTGLTTVRKPDGGLLCIYLPGALRHLTDQFYDVLHPIRSLTDNRGHAAGSVRVKAGTTRTRAKPVSSAILGAFDAQGPKQYCRFTAFTAREGERFNELRPLFQEMGSLFAQHVPDRFKAQMAYVEQSKPEWVIPGTPFTTITVNNSYPTGVHTDKGDLDEGFSCLGVLRRGPYSGGRLTMPQHRVAVDMADGDLLLMDAHQPHGNTRMVCECGTSMDRPCSTCGAERISIVAYFRTAVAACDTLEVEDAKRMAYAEKRSLTA